MRSENCTECSLPKSESDNYISSGSIRRDGDGVFAVYARVIGGVAGMNCEIHNHANCRTLFGYNFLETSPFEADWSRQDAKVAELADAPDLGSGGETHGGSSPSFRTSRHREVPRLRSGFRLRTPRLVPTRIHARKPAQVRVPPFAPVVIARSLGVSTPNLSLDRDAA